MQISNAIAWGHLQLKGGWKNIFMVGAAYLAIVGGLILVSVRLDPFSSTRVLGSWTMGLMGLQIAILLLYGCYAVGGGVRKDLASKMIESHRLMPISGTDAVIGYILGSGSQAMVMALINLILGLVISPWGGFVTPLGWLKANLILGVFAACSWVVVVFLTLAMPVGSRVVMGLAVVMVMGHQGLAPIFPGMSILFGPALGESIFGVIATNRMTDPFRISMAAQVLVTTICFVGGMRRYRRDDVLSWGPMMSLAALAAYVAISIAGLSLWELMMPRRIGIERIPFEVQLMLSATGALLAGILPVCAVAWLRAAYERRRALHDPAPNPAPASTALVILAASLVAAALLPLALQARWYVCTHDVGQSMNVRFAEPGIGPGIPRMTNLQTALVFVAFLTSANYILRAMYRRGPRSAVGIMVLFVLLTWVGPPLVDFLMNQAMEGFGTEPRLTALSLCSPPMLLSHLWADVGPDAIRLGLAVQCLLAIILAVVFHTAKPRAQTATAPGKP